jgi:transmembrane sensor
MEHSRGIATLIFKHIRKDLTPEEADLLQRWIEQSEMNRMFFEEVTQPGQLFTEAQTREEDDRDINMNEVWQKLVNKGIPAQTYYMEMERPSSRRGWYAAAAVLFLCLLGGGYYFLTTQKHAQPPIAEIKPKPPSTPVIKNDVMPTTRKAMLTLADGSVVELDSSQSGVLAFEGNTAVTKKADGQIVYDMTAGDHALLYNTLTVPKGSNVVNITLSDGTKVWLNAASSLRYPVAFPGNERKVEITGEAYFEVAHNAAAPFKVSKGNMDVTVLGTRFNVNAYREEEAVKVTLLQGSVTVSVQNEDIGKQKMLKPGQQAIVNQEDVTVSSRIDQEAIMAWKNGLFYFDNTNIDIIVRQIERWYDVSIEYDNALENVAFNGQISRYSNASEVLEMLETAEALRFEIKDRKIYLKPYTK